MIYALGILLLLLLGLTQRAVSGVDPKLKASGEIETVVNYIVARHGAGWVLIGIMVAQVLVSGALLLQFFGWIDFAL